MRHREHMPFTCAWLQEVLRHRPLLPLMAPRKTGDDVNLRGYEIPKDTAVFVHECVKFEINPTLIFLSKGNGEHLGHSLQRERFREPV